MVTYIIIGVAVALAVLLCLFLAIANFSMDNYETELKEKRKLGNKRGINTLDFVFGINKKFFNGKLQMAKCDEFKDCYSKGMVALSDSTMGSNSIASLATVAHELGHARQDKEGKKLNKLWQCIFIGRLMGIFFMPLEIVGVVISLLNIFEILPQHYYLIIGYTCIAVGIFIFLFAIVLKYVEIRIEKEASDFAIEYLKAVLDEGELKAAKEFLDCARLTYWAALFRTMLGWTRLTSKEKMFR